jgi:hypothetical protein
MKKMKNMNNLNDMKNFNHINHIRTLATLLSAASLCLTLALFTGCEKKDAPAPATPKAASNTPAPAKPAGSSSTALPTTPQGAAAALGFEMPNIQIPTQDDLDAKIAKTINEQNADTEFQNLEKELETETSKP